MRVVIVSIALVVTSGCADFGSPAGDEAASGAATDEGYAEVPVAAWTPDSGLPPFAERTDPNPERGSWMQQLTPTSQANCTFTKRPVADRPDGLDVQAWSGNMDLLAEGEVLSHDHAIGFVEAGFMSNSPVIAVRDGLPDLWIEPTEPYGEVTLRIGADEFVCVRPSFEAR